MPRPASPTGQAADDSEFRLVQGAVLRECILNLARVKEAISQNVGARSSCPTGSSITAGVTPADGAGRQIIGIRISESVWYGPL